MVCEVRSTGNNTNLTSLQTDFMIEEAKRKIRACDAIGEKFGLSLTEKEITDLVEGRKSALAASGRFEFAGGILPNMFRH